MDKTKKSFKKPMRIEAYKIDTLDGVCPGIAKTTEGEVFISNGRTPENPICIQALNSILPMSHAMSLTDKMEWEKNDYFEITCPHGAVTFRISRVLE